MKPVCCILFTTLAHANTVDSNTDTGANPIRKVVNMLQMMQNKITAEGKKKEELFDKYMCYCNNADATLGAQVDNAGKKIPLVESGIKESKATKEQLESDLKDHQQDRSEAKEAVAKATAIREKEAKVFAKESAELKTNLAAMNKAIPAIENGMTGFLQTTTASILKKLSLAMDMSSVDRDVLASFLSGQASYMPKSGEIVGILKTMRDEMNSDLKDMTDAENQAISDFDALVSAKNKEVRSLSKAIEEKMLRVGELGVQIAQMQNDLEDTREGLDEDQKMLQDLDKNCASKKKEWAVYKQIQAEELVAVADTIKILNDDDALELFKKTLPGSSSLLQVHTAADVRKNVVKALRGLSVKAQDPRFDFLVLALSGNKLGFDKVIKMIDKMVAELKTEQLDDDTKKSWCETELDAKEDAKKQFEQEKEDLETAIEEAQEALANLVSELKALKTAVKQLDKDVMEQTEQRQKEHAEYLEAMAANKAVVDLLNFAKNRLNKFYNPKQYKAPKDGLEEAQLDQEEVPKAPEADLSYKKKGEESSGVIAMIDTMIKDVEKDVTESEVEEKDAQTDYEAFMDTAARKRQSDSRDITDKTSAKADTQAQLDADNEALKNKKYDLMNIAQQISSVHGECDFLLKYYDARKEARASEIDSLTKAKAVLKGADFSELLQKSIR